jgi:hypothetical protein
MVPRLVCSRVRNEILPTRNWLKGREGLVEFPEWVARMLHEPLEQRFYGPHKNPVLSLTARLFSGDGFVVAASDR